MGFILGHQSYLGDTWNWMDFGLVVTSLLDMIPQLKKVTGLRTFRLFRPLRSLAKMPSMRLLIGTLFSSMEHLSGIFVLLGFILTIFAILGVSLWDGVIHYRCYETQDPLPDGSWRLIEEDVYLCSSFRSCPIGFCNSRMNVTGPGPLGNRDLWEADLWKDTDIEALNYGITNFDNFFYAFLTVFQCITMQGWGHIMDIYADVYADWFVNVYFVSCVIICSFFLLNLTTAVMLMKYEDLDKATADQKHKADLRQYGRSINLPSTLIEFLIK
jgi:hypothetical protein